MTNFNESPDERRELRRRLVELTKELILFPSTHSRPSDRHRCADFIKYHLEDLDGVTIRDQEGESDYPYFVALPESAPSPDVLICAHLDVIEHPHLEAYYPKESDGRIIGPGAGDMKGPLAICVELFRRLHQRQPGISLGLAVTSDEEIGGHHGIRRIFGEDGQRCGLAMIPDGGSPDELTVEEKGILHAEVVVRTGGESSHASRPWLAKNAVHRLVGVLSKIHEHFGTLAHEENRWYPTCSMTVVNTPNRTINRIPSEARAQMDVRFPPPHSAASMVKEIEDVLADESGNEFEVSLRELISAEPTTLSPDPRFREIAEEVRGQPISLVRESGGSDARFVCPYGIPVIMSRPTMGRIHSEDEWIQIDSMLEFYTIYERYLTEKLSG
ncbi:MAG: M20 family metallopeptidase [Planctomycetota bacterium]